VERDVRRLRALVAPGMGVKAAGGIRTRADLERMVRAGATRIGTSAGAEIMKSYPEQLGITEMTNARKSDREEDRISVELGPGIRFAAPKRPRNS